MGLDGVVAPTHDVSSSISSPISVQNSVPPLTTLSTVKDLVEWLAGTTPLVLKRGSPRTREEIASVVKQIVVEQLGLRDDEYGADKRFVEDLGVD